MTPFVFVRSDPRGRRAYACRHRRGHGTFAGPVGQIGHGGRDCALEAGLVQTAASIVEAEAARAERERTELDKQGPQEPELERLRLESADSQAASTSAASLAAAPSAAAAATGAIGAPRTPRYWSPAEVWEAPLLEWADDEVQSDATVPLVNFGAPPGDRDAGPVQASVKCASLIDIIRRPRMVKSHAD